MKKPKYEVFYQRGKGYMVCNGDHVVADKLTEEEAKELAGEFNK